MTKLTEYELYAIKNDLIVNTVATAWEAGWQAAGGAADHPGTPNPYLGDFAFRGEAPNGLCDVCGAPIVDAIPGCARTCPVDFDHDPYSDGFQNGGDPVVTA